LYLIVHGECAVLKKINTIIKIISIFFFLFIINNNIIILLISNLFSIYTSFQTIKKIYLNISY
jgi:hypothetical protein